MTAPVEAVGVDGWKDGWVAATVQDGRVRWRTFVQDTTPGAPRTAFARLLERFPGATVAVDVPIGTVDGTRHSDLAAKAYLQQRGATPASLFATPPTATVDAHRRGLDHRAAMAEARDAGLAGTSIQAWNLIPKMIEVQDALSARPDAIAVEAHPECSFRTLDERIGAASKKTGLGVARRLRALQAVSELDLLDAPDGVPTDDLLDAVAVLWTAGRVRAGTALRLPEDAGRGEPVIHI